MVLICAGLMTCAACILLMVIHEDVELSGQLHDCCKKQLAICMPGSLGLGKWAIQTPSKHYKLCRSI